MTEGNGKTNGNFEMVKLPSRFHNGQHGLYKLSELPQQGSVEAIALDTGWWELDQLLRIYPGQFLVVTGLAGSGKSTFLFNLICNLARRHGTASFLYVPENEQHLRDKLKRIWGDEGFGYLAADKIFVQSAMPVTYTDPPHTLAWVLDQAVSAIERDSVDLLLLDPWNEIEWAKPRDWLMTEYIAECLKMLKSFARAYSVTVMMVAHPTKDVLRRGGTPTLGDIEGSMAWYNKCDNGLIIEQDKKTKATKVISAKVRERGAGKTGVCWFTFDEATERFTPQHGAVTNEEPRPELATPRKHHRENLETFGFDD